uniref:Uncharacterized protein n=1 Tax=Anguilla anguilla TaxID=7936 RepID=A0A0E9R4F5_ANGAN
MLLDSAGEKEATPSHCCFKNTIIHKDQCEGQPSSLSILYTHPPGAHSG